MKGHPLRLGLVVTGLIVLALVALGGGTWWFFVGQYSLAEVPASSPVEVFLLSPMSGDEAAAGDSVMVNLQAVAPEAISWAEVFVDGMSLGAVTESPESVSWTWQAWPAGIHVLSGRAQAADGHMGESQTVILNVVATDETIQVQAGASETLAQVGARYGVAAVQMAGANPSIDASKALGDGQAVRVPIGASSAQPAGGGEAPGGGSGTGGGRLPFSIKWELQITGQVDRSYCYLSSGYGEWDKMPKPPFEFFGGRNGLYTQVFDVTPPSDAAIQAQCWGWLGGALKYLGQAEARMTPGSLIRLPGDGVLLSGEPNWPEGTQPPVGKPQYKVPPPYAVRKTEDPAECFSHKGTLELCKQAIANPTATSFVLIWEWMPFVDLSGATKWNNVVDGYRVYRIDPPTGMRQFLKAVVPGYKKMALLPIPSGKSCYGVEAVAEGFQVDEYFFSDMVTYCPGTEPPTKKIVLKPVNWLSVGHFAESQDCNSKEFFHFLFADYYDAKPNDLMVGSIFQQDADCGREADVAGAVKFLLPQLPGGAVVQGAKLRFAETFNEYGASGLATNMKLACADGWGTAKQDWTGLVNADHYVDYYEKPNLLMTTAYYKSLDSLSGWDHSPDLDVKWQVIDWIEDPASNHGFILSPRLWPVPAAANGSGECFSQFGGFELEISYFTP